MHKDSARQLAIEAKYLQPRLDHVSLRPDVRQTFAVGFGRRLTVVCAPAGYGKTTTTAAALQQCGCTSAWYKLDILDHDPLAFLAGVVRAVRRPVPTLGESLLRELESGPVLDVPVEVLAARFCSECDGHVATDLHLVLDDYHEAMDAPAMNDVLGYLLESCPSTIHFVVLTRYEPVFRLEKLNLAGEVARIARDLLLFDVGQVADVLRQRSGRQHDPEHVHRLLVLTEGWPASVVLAGMNLVWLDADSLEDALSDPRLRTDVFSYLAEQVFQRQTAEVQRFLLRTCCLDHVSVPVAERLTGTEAGRHLHFLARNHIFTFDTGRAGRYRYHNLLRDFLRQRFVQDEGESSFHGLQRDTAVALEGCGDRPGAIELLLGANELTLALEAVGRGGEAELERRPSEQLRHWLERTQPANYTDHPWTLILAGVICARDGRFDEALADLRRAVGMLSQMHDPSALYQALSVTEWAEFWSGDARASVITCERALAFARTDAQRLHTLLSLMSAALDVRQWNAVEAASVRAGALLPRALPDEIWRAEALRAHAALYQGDARAAQELMSRCSHSEQAAGQRAAILHTRGIVSMTLGELGAARQHLLGAAKAIDGFGHALTSYMIEDTLALWHASVGDSPGALARLQALRSDHEHVREQSLLCSSFTHESTVLRRCGRVEDSLGPGRLAVGALEANRDPYLALNAAANLAFAEGLLGAERRAALGRLSGEAASAGLRFVELKAQLYAGILAHTEASQSEAVDLLEQCVPRQLELGHINLIAQELTPRPELASLLLRRHRNNGLGPPLLDALSHHWGFAEASLVLRAQCASQVGTWIDHIAASQASPASLDQPGDAPPTKHLSGGRAPDGRSESGDLTAREREVLRLMAQDLSNEEIAAELFIALSTVKTHVNHVLRKLGQTKRLGAVLEYQRLTGSIDAPPGQSRPHLHPRQ